MARQRDNSPRAKLARNIKAHERRVAEFNARIAETSQPDTQVQAVADRDRDDQ
jgi:hypothetical protein